MNSEEIKSLWKNDKESIEEYISATLTDEKTAEIEKRLGYKLPQSYIDLMKIQNGGKLAKNFFQIKNEQGTVFRSFLLFSIDGIGDDVRCSLCGELGNAFWTGDSWGYPDIGVYIAGFSEPMLGIIALDYSQCGPTGEPEVVHLETRNKQCKKTFLAKNFEDFICGLGKRPKLAPFPFEKLEEQLKEAAKEAFLEVSGLHEDEKICAFALLVDEEASMVFPSTNSNGHLDSLIKEASADAEYYATEPCEWKYNGDGAAEKFGEINDGIFSYKSLLTSESELKKFRNSLIETCTRTLEELQNTGFFAKACSGPIYLSVSGVSFDFPKARQKDIRRRLGTI